MTRALAPGPRPSLLSEKEGRSTCRKVADRVGAALRIRRASPALALLKAQSLPQARHQPKSGRQALRAHDQTLVGDEGDCHGVCIDRYPSYVLFLAGLKVPECLKRHRPRPGKTRFARRLSKLGPQIQIHFQQPPPRSGQVFFPLYNIVTASPKRVSSQIFARRRIQIPGRCTQHLTSPLSQRSCHGCKIVLRLFVYFGRAITDVTCEYIT